MPIHSLTAEAIDAARARIPAAFQRSPQFVSEALSEHVGSPVLVKVESVNPVGCFKGRGAWLAVAELARAGRVDRRRGIVVASAGNFGQGVAYAARALDVPVVVHAATTASEVKVAAMERLGAIVLRSGGDFDAARLAAAADAGQRAWLLLIDGQDPNIAVGAGTMAFELTDAIERGDLPQIAEIYVPVGNGSLIAGVGSWLRHAAPNVRVIGVQAERAPAMTLSWRAGRPIETASADTIADGIATRVAIPEALDLMRGTVDDMLLVSETEIAGAQAELTRALTVTVEPAAAAAWAAQRRTSNGRAAAFVLSGGNV
jgi:threonine dehydratase